MIICVADTIWVKTIGVRRNNHPAGGCVGGLTVSNPKVTSAWITGDKKSPGVNT